MKLGKFLKAFAPVVAVALAAGASGCDATNIKINGEEGKPLAELDLSGPAPSELVLLGPDEVRVTTGETLAITVEGNDAAKDQLRFTLKDGALGILRKDRLFSKDGGTAVVNVTMPAPREVTMAGSGKISAAALATSAKVTIAGSGDVETPNVLGDSLDLTVAGSGDFRAAGTVRKLDMSVAGSGSATMDALKVDQARITIAGSGSASFASDGEVEADIFGSGEVRVKGRARCKVSAMGSGRLVCETPAETKAAPTPPTPPPAPEAPKAP